MLWCSRYVHRILEWVGVHVCSWLSSAVRCTFPDICTRILPYLTLLLLGYVDLSCATLVHFYLSLTLNFMSLPVLWSYICLLNVAGPAEFAHDMVSPWSRTRGAQYAHERASEYQLYKPGLLAGSFAAADRVYQSRQQLSRGAPYPTHESWQEPPSGALRPH